jgi:hypothetical protein
MAYIPDDAKWYIAEIVQENRIEGDTQSVVYVNWNLIRADSPEEAYDRAMELGQNLERDYENTDGKTVTVRFRGLSDLHVIHDELEHGAELIYEKFDAVEDDEMAKYVLDKSQLSVFQPYEPPSPDSPNLMPASVAAELMKYLREIEAERDNNRENDEPNAS